MTAQKELLEAAARCYLRAGDEDDACHCYEQLGAWAEAAGLHERAGRVREAAEGYERAGRRDLDAARCYRAVGDFASEARCLARAGEKVRAAWVLAHDLGQAREARELVLEPEPGTMEYMAPELPHVRVPLALVHARCDVVQGERAAAARALHDALPAIHALPAEPLRRRLSDWALVIAEALRRPDLGAVVIATLEDGGAGAEQVWDAWAQRTFGEAVAPPVQLALEAAGEQESKDA